MLKKLAFRRRLARIAARRYVGTTSTPPHAALLRQQLLFQQAPFHECHAATISADHGNLTAAWFAGSAEGQPDVDIWCTCSDKGEWSPPQRVTQDLQPAWNPVLFRPANGPLQLYYKLGPNPHDWWGVLRESGDDGHHWSEPRQLPPGIYGPIKNKPLQLPDGRPGPGHPRHPAQPAAARRWPTADAVPQQTGPYCQQLVKRRRPSLE